MRKRSKLPVMYMIICIWMVFTAFDLFENPDIGLLQKLSYIFLIIGPLAFIVLSVWLGNARKESSAFSGTAFCLPAGIASALIGAGLMAGPVFAAIAAVPALCIAGLGFNAIRNLNKPAALVYVDLPPERAKELERRYRYERFGRFKTISLPADRLSEILTAGGGEAVHAILTRDPALIIRLKEKRLLAAQFGENRKELPAFMKDPDGYWTCVNINPVAAGIDATAWKKIRGTDPSPVTSFQTLLSPNLAGAYGIPDPEKSKSGYLFLAGLVQAFGEGEGISLYKKLARRAGATFGDPISYQGVFAKAGTLAAIGLLDDLLRAGVGATPVVIGIPAGAGFEMTMAAIPVDSPDPGLSREFLEFITSREGNGTLAAKARRYPAHPKALVPPGCPPQPEEGARHSADFDYAAAMAGREGLLARFRAAPEPTAYDDDSTL